MFLNRLRLFFAPGALVLLLTPVMHANTRKGDKLLKEGAKAEAQKDYDKAIDLYGQALHADPKDAGYQLADRRARFKSAELHVNDGLKLRDQQKLEEALVEFQRAFVVDPSYTISVQEIQN